MTKATIFAIVIIGFALRVTSLANIPLGLSVFEINTAIQALYFWQFDYYQYLSSASPLYSFLTSIIFFQLQPDFALLRLVSVISGTLTIYLVYQLSLALLQVQVISRANTRSAHLNQKYIQNIAISAALFFAISPFSIHVSRIASPESLGLFLILLFWLSTLKVINLGLSTNLWRILLTCSFILLIFTDLKTLLIAGILLTTSLLLTPSQQPTPRIITVFIVSTALITLAIAFTFTSFSKISTDNIATIYDQYFTFQALFFKAPTSSIYMSNETGFLLLSFVLLVPIGLYKLAKYSSQVFKLITYPASAVIFIALIYDNTQSYIYIIFFYTTLIILSSVAIQELMVLQKVSIRISLLIIAFSTTIYSATNYYHVYFKHYTQDNWPIWNEHLVKTAQYVSKNYDPTYPLHLESESSGQLFVLYFDTLYHSGSKARTVVSSQNLDTSQIPHNAVAAFHGFRTPPVTLSNIYEITNTKREKDIIMKVGLWQKD